MLHAKATPSVAKVAVPMGAVQDVLLVPVAITVGKMGISITVADVVDVQPLLLVIVT